MATQTYDPAQQPSKVDSLFTILQLPITDVHANVSADVYADDV